MELTGQKLGKYELLEKLGQGGMAEVYKARQPTIERLVAIKVLQSSLADSPQFVERFKREAQRLGQLRHPNIVSVLDFDVDRGIHFLVMDYVSGPSLRAYLDKRRSLTPIESLRLASQITDALGYAHARGVIHCDMKPANVMFLDETYKQIVLADFGIARLIDTTGSAQTSLQIGTPTYMSPEAAQNKPLDGRADLYSLGVMLYEMVTGRVPYEGDTPINVLLQHLNAPLPDLRKTYPGIPNEFVLIVERALAKKPEDRYQNAFDMHRAIEAALASLGQHVSPATMRLTPEEATRQVSRADLGQISTSAPQVRMNVPPTTALPMPGVPSRTSIPRTSVLQPSSVLSASQRVAPPRRMLHLGIAGLAGLVILCVAVVAIGALALTGHLGFSPLLASGTAKGSAASDSAANRFGSLKVLLDGKGQPAQFQLFLDHVAKPPANVDYVLWFGKTGQWANAGKVKVENGSIFVQLPTSPNASAHLQQALITQEKSSAPASSPSDKVMFSGQYPQALQNIYNQFLVTSSEPTSKPLLPAILEQVTIAKEHQGYMMDAIAKGDLKEARHHVEHVINTLTGKGNPGYGDLDKSGAIENPGDDVGVIKYITDVTNQLAIASNAEPGAAFRKDLADQSTATYNDSQIVIQELIQLNEKILSTENVSDANLSASHAQMLFQKLLYGENGKGGLNNASRQAMAAIELSMVAGSAGPQWASIGTAADPQGIFTLSLDNNYTFQLDGSYNSPTGTHFTLWAAQPDAKQYLMLGNLPAGGLALAGKSPVPNLDGFSQVLLSLETDPNAKAPSQTVLTGNLAAQAINNFESKLNNPQDGELLTKANQQAKIVNEHLGYLITALKKGDLATAKQHSEHVINALNGKSGPHYGDINRDGTVEDPGDGVGVYGYLTLIGNAAQDLQKESLTDNQKFYLDRLLAAQKAAIQQINATSETALKIIAADTPQEAGGTGDTVQAMLNSLIAGTGGDTHLDTDPLLGAGNLQVIQVLAGDLRSVEMH